MKKNTLIIVSVGVLLAFVVLISWSVGSQKNQPPANLNTAIVTTNVPALDFSITLKDFSFAPNEFTAGLSQTIKVELINAGAVAHAFTFSKLDFNSGVIEPGQSKTVTFTTPSKAGRYEFFCDQVGHKDKGMTGAMVVQ